MQRRFESYPFRADMHTARMPVGDGAEEPGEHPVAIVGGGVVGLATALALARHGVASVVLEADESVCLGSRAICISRRSLEILARHGAVAPFLATGLPWTGGRSFYRHHEVLRFAMPHDASQRLPPMVNIQQYYIEQFLLEACLGTGRVEVRWRSRLEEMQTQGPGARLTVRTPAGSYTLRARWVIGCDGARSRVRELTGLKLEGTSYEGRYVIVDVRLRSARPTERLAWFDPPSNPGSTLLMHRQPDDVWRIDYQLRDDEDPQAAVDPGTVVPRVASHLRMIGESEDWAPIWISLYRANALTLPTYQRGRVLLAGDAAHLVPIFGVRGANSAFEDADNLAWKLALVLHGLAPESLLDSYSTERVGAARDNLREGMKSTEFMSPPSYGFELMRTAVLGLAVDHPFLRPLINPRQTGPSRYAASALALADTAPWNAGPAPGCVATECPVLIGPRSAARPGHVTELFGAGFTLLCFAQSTESCAALARAARSTRLPVRMLRIAGSPGDAGEPEVVGDPDGQLAAAWGASPGTVYLMRPDGFVLGRWRTADPAAVQAALAGVTRPPEQSQRGSS